MSNTTKKSPFREQFLRRAQGSEIAVSDDQLERLERYYGLLERWNPRINLTSLPLAGFPDATVDRLLVEPVAAAKFVKDAPLTWFDLGSGGGSPAIPLKILRPRLRLAMVESRGRKAAFLREAVRSLDFDDSVVFAQRIEELASDPIAHAKADLVTVRAVRMDEELIRNATTLLKIDGKLLLFAGSDSKAVRPRQLELMGQRDLLPTQSKLVIWQKRP